MLDELKRQVCRANLALAAQGLVTLTWGNVSGVDRKRGLMVIKPSGVAYERMKPADMVVTDLDARAVGSALKPSSDAPSHAEIYRAFPEIGGIVHTHSAFATMFAQALREIPCFGTTHADHFYGPVPLTRLLTRRETMTEYERNTGRVIVERLRGGRPLERPGILVASHGPFAWGRDACEAVVNAVALEAVAKMAFGTVLLDPEAVAVRSYLLDKHYLRKHGPTAYYGQKTAAGHAPAGSTRGRRKGERA